MTITRSARAALVSALTAMLLLLGAVAANPAQAASGRGSASSYSLTKVGKGVLRWNPCQVVHYRVNTRFAPPGALADVKAAVAVVSKATGITFRYDGATTVIPTKSYGSKFTPGKAPLPLVIAWAAPGKGAGRSDLLSGKDGEAGYGMNRAVWWTDSSGRLHNWRIVTGAAVFNTAYNDELPAGFASGEPTRGELVLHELGHVMGLNHVNDESQIMYPTLGDESTFGAGDLAGLKKVGRTAGCIR